MREEVYRGVLEIEAYDYDFGGRLGAQHYDAQVRKSRAYDKPGPAKAWVTSKAKQGHYRNHITDRYVEVSDSWKRVD